MVGGGVKRVTALLACALATALEINRLDQVTTVYTWDNAGQSFQLIVLSVRVPFLSDTDVLHDSQQCTKWFP